MNHYQAIVIIWLIIAVATLIFHCIEHDIIPVAAYTIYEFIIGLLMTWILLP